MLRNSIFTVFFLVTCLFSQAIATTFTVTNTKDSGAGSLRQAIEDANADSSATAHDLHEIEISIRDEVIYLDSDDLNISNHIRISGIDRDYGVTIDARGSSEESKASNRIISIEREYTVELENLVLRNGEISSEGGAILNEGDLTMKDCWLHSNFGTLGGAVASLNGESKFINCTFSDNISETRGGALIIENAAELTLVNCTITNNEALNFFEGGGIYNASQLDLVNCTISGNKAVEGAGIYNADNCRLINSIVANSKLGRDTAGTRVISLEGVNLVEDGSVSDYHYYESVITGDPLLGPLAQNGGSVPTHSLNWNSPAIDAGDDGSFHGAIDEYVDARGYERFTVADYDYYYDNNQIDLGAVEMPPEFPKLCNLPTGLIFKLHSDEGFELTREFLGDTEGWGDFYLDKIDPDSQIREEFEPNVIGYGEHSIIYDLGSPMYNNDPLSQKAYFTIYVGGAINLDEANEQSFRAALETLSESQTSEADDIHTITIDDSMAGETIYLPHGALEIAEKVRIVAPEAGITLSAKENGNDNHSNSRVISTKASAHLVLANITIKDGYEEGGSGGGIHNSGTLELKKCNVISNSAPDENGGGIFTEGNLWIEDTELESNSSRDGGGLYTRTAGIINIERSTFHANTASLDGGGLRNAFTRYVTLINTTFASNSAETGGGMSNWDVLDTFVMHNTFSGNSAEVNGGGIYQDNESTHMQVTNTIIANSTNGDFDHEGGSLDFNGVNIISDGSESSALAFDPLLLPLNDNGGYVKTFGMQSISPALNATDYDGSVDRYGRQIMTDSRGVARAVSGNSDIGAVEMPAGLPEFSNLPDHFVIVTREQAQLTIDDSFTGASPVGGVYSYMGNTLTSFDSSNYAVGSSHVISYFIDQESGDPLANSASFTIYISETENPLLVTTDQDIVDSNDGLNSFREAILFANTQSDNPTINFNTDPSLGVDFDATQHTIYLTEGELQLSGLFRIVGPNGVGVSLDARDSHASSIDNHRILHLEASADISIEFISFQNATTSFRGGAIGNDGTLQVSDSTIYNSHAGEGGAIYSSGYLYLDRCTIYECSASGDGGAICSLDGSVSVNNCTLSSNNAGNRGGGIYKSGNGSLELIHNTIYKNSASLIGGVYCATTSIYWVYYNIIASSVGGDFYAPRALITSGTCIVPDGTMSGAITTNPQLGTLKDNGGYVLTHAPSITSPAIDAFNISNAEGRLDARGFNRIVDFNNDGNSYTDIGAIELHSFDVPPPITNLTKRVNGDKQIAFEAEAGKTYCIEYSHDLEEWFTASDDVNQGVWTDDGTETVDHPSVRQKRFYRIYEKIPE